MTELEKCLAGEKYDCHDASFLERKNRTRKLLQEYHALSYAQKEEKREILNRLFGKIGSNVSVGQPFLCDYGCNIYLGDNVSINMNCTFVDCNQIEIGSNVLIASNVQLYTATHPVELAERLTPDWRPETGEYFCRTYALPIRIGDGSWLGGGVIVLPGVTIGNGCVIGAGSVVTKDIPDNSLAVGNPCRVIRKLNKEAAVSIRRENEKDYDRVYELVKEAFAGAEYSDGWEQDLVEALRKSEAFVPELSLVAEMDGVIAGHIMFSEAKVGENTVLVLAPLSVAADCQGRGVGTALITQGHKIARGLGYSHVLVLGSETYYPRCGYLPASQFGIETPAGMPPCHFMAIALQEHAKHIGGGVTYAKEFGMGDCNQEPPVL